MQNSNLCRHHLFPYASSVGRTDWLPPRDHSVNRGKHRIIQQGRSLWKPLSARQVIEFNVSTTTPCGKHALLIGSKGSGIVPLQCSFQTPRPSHEKDTRHGPTKAFHKTPKRHSSGLSRWSKAPELYETVVVAWGHLRRYDHYVECGPLNKTPKQKKDTG